MKKIVRVVFSVRIQMIAHTFFVIRTTAQTHRLNSVAAAKVRPDR